MRVEVSKEGVHEGIHCIAEQGVRVDVIVLWIHVRAAEGEDWAVVGGEGVEEQGGDLRSDRVVEKPEDVGSG